ncbi:multidrug ABC transporter ATP-binding protein [Malaciobacter molluscorum LMG 25693]|uniref:Multidrug ABC transporter ATP-binding protein n=1 Tax=Malaciobacter molluscorum LMG 25693 TaxID=870501 RepID=A0A2G1DI46_9BACT|nr:ATP-binding cassette domain-containing protein [Malaciobacter molluscorum]AXX92398.1 multidrug resistance ABC transporter, ATP-binding protein [Malaciobacter molluscorum LMG 25693]PHO18155.1 multidrug ABC transporter ATP-binding protein [Malaciobacter molluscorum LMG 25693]
MSLVKIDNLSKSFDNNFALNDITIDIKGKMVTGLVGPDGAGKTTLIRLMTGLLDKTSGNINVLGYDLPKFSHEIQKDIGYMPQKFGLYEDLSVKENLLLYAKLQEIPKNEIQNRINELLSFTNLSDFDSFLAKNLSGGMKQKLGLACALIKKPKLLLLDEPGVGVDPISRRELWDIVQQLIKDNVGVIWSTAYLDEAELCDEVILLDHGKILFNGNPNELKKTMNNKVFKLVGSFENKRETLRLALKNDKVKDGVILGNSIKLVCEDEKFLPKLNQINATNCKYEKIEPNFEDGFMNILNGNFNSDSPLSSELKTLEKIEGSLIEAISLTKKFGNFTATNNVSFQIKQGEIFGFLGPNGAGKSTTFKMLCGLLHPSSGEAKVLGLSLEKSSYKARKKIGYMSQKFALYGDISVIENMKFFAGIYGLKGKEKDNKIKSMIKIFELEKYLKYPAKDLPLGFKQRLALSCAVMHNPSVLFLDEPTSGIDPITRREFWNHIYAMVKKGMTIMVTTHFMDEAEYCDRIALIYKGKAIALDTPHNLISQVGKNATMEDAFIELIKRNKNA